MPSKLGIDLSPILTCAIEPAGAGWIEYETDAFARMDVARSHESANFGLPGAANASNWKWQVSGSATTTTGDRCCAD